MTRLLLMSLTVTQQQIAENVRATLRGRQISQAALAEALGLTQVAMSRRLRGVHAFRADEMAAVAEFLDVPVAELYRAAA